MSKKKALRFVVNVKSGVPFVLTKHISDGLHKKNMRDLRVMPEGWQPGDDINVEPVASDELSGAAVQALLESLAKNLPDADSNALRAAVADATGTEFVAVEVEEPTPPVVESALADPNELQVVVAAIGQMDKDNPDDYTNGGKPDANRLSTECGFNVSAALRDEAFEVFEALEA